MSMGRTRRDTPVYETNDIIHGFGEVPAVHQDGKLGWVLPGRGITYDKDEAEHHAKRLDSLIQANMKRFDRSLIW